MEGMSQSLLQRLHRNTLEEEKLGRRNPKCESVKIKKQGRRQGQRERKPRDVKTKKTTRR